MIKNRKSRCLMRFPSRFPAMPKHNKNRPMLALALCCFSTALQASEIQADSDSYRQVISQLKPGDTVTLAPGRYTRGPRVLSFSFSFSKLVITSPIIASKLMT